MSWIETIPYDKAQAGLRKIYDRVKGPDDNIDNVLQVHSLRPHSLLGHMALYKGVLHHTGNKLPKWLLEALGTYVSKLNHCDYCVAHHLAGFARICPASIDLDQFRKVIDEGSIERFFEGRHAPAFGYARKLTLAHQHIVEEDIIELRESGFSDGEILEINQVVSYFNYVNRVVLGLGVEVDEVLGLSPSDNTDPDNWRHS